MEELVDAYIDYLLHYGDSDHWFFIPQAKDEEDALRYFFCIEGYGQSRQFGTLQREFCLLVPLQQYLQDRDAIERRVERLRRDIRARREAEEGL